MLILHALSSLTDKADFYNTTTLSANWCILLSHWSTNHPSFHYIAKGAYFLFSTKENIQLSLYMCNILMKKYDTFLC